VAGGGREGRVGARAGGAGGERGVVGGAGRRAGGRAGRAGQGGGGGQGAARGGRAPVFIFCFSVFGSQPGAQWLEMVVFRPRLARSFVLTQTG